MRSEGAGRYWPEWTAARLECISFGTWASPALCLSCTPYGSACRRCRSSARTNLRTASGPGGKKKKEKMNTHVPMRSERAAPLLHRPRLYLIMLITSLKTLMNALCNFFTTHCDVIWKHETAAVLTPSPRCYAHLYWSKLQNKNICLCCWPQLSAHRVHRTASRLSCWRTWRCPQFLPSCWQWAATRRSWWRSPSHQRVLSKRQWNWIIKEHVHPCCIHFSSNQHACCFSLLQYYRCCC